MPYPPNLCISSFRIINVAFSTQVERLKLMLAAFSERLYEPLVSFSIASILKTLFTYCSLYINNNIVFMAGMRQKYAIINITTCLMLNLLMKI